MLILFVVKFKDLYNKEIKNLELSVLQVILLQKELTLVN